MHVVDLTRYYCTATVCPAVIGGVVVHRDPTHLTNTFAKTLAPYYGAAIAAALADTEFAIRAEEATNTLFARWRFLHILLGCLIFALLALHVGAAIYYGLRWL